jgi:hypothetical protein
MNIYSYTVFEIYRVKFIKKLLYVILRARVLSSRIYKCREKSD